jgi:predicted DNA-binding transcriptional regulator AlpA
MSNHETSTQYPEIRLIGWPELKTKLGGRSYSSVLRDEKADRFPRRVRVGERGFGWYAHEIDAYLLGLPRK